MAAPVRDRPAPVIAAASTHPGEDIELIDVHRRLKHSFPGLPDDIRCRGIRNGVRASPALPAARD